MLGGFSFVKLVHWIGFSLREPVKREPGPDLNTVIRMLDDLGLFRLNTAHEIACAREVNVQIGLCSLDLIQRYAVRHG